MDASALRALRERAGLSHVCLLRRVWVDLDMYYAEAPARGACLRVRFPDARSLLAAKAYGRRSERAEAHMPHVCAYLSCE